MTGWMTLYYSRSGPGSPVRGRESVQADPYDSTMGPNYSGQGENQYIAVKAGGDPPAPNRAG